MPGLVPGIHAAERSDRLCYCAYGRIDLPAAEEGGSTWMAGTSPAMTERASHNPLKILKLAQTRTPSPNYSAALVALRSLAARCSSRHDLKVKNNSEAAINASPVR